MQQWWPTLPLVSKGSTELATDVETLAKPGIGEAVGGLELTAGADELGERARDRRRRPLRQVKERRREPKTALPPFIERSRAASVTPSGVNWSQPTRRRLGDG